MKKSILPKIINRTNLFDNSFNIEGKYTKNSILKYNLKSNDKRYNNTSNNNKFKLKIFDRGMHTRQNSNKLIESLKPTKRNFSNKKLFCSNSYQKRDKICKTNTVIHNKIINTNTENNKLEMNKTNINIKHKKLFSLQASIINSKKNSKANNDINAINNKFNTNINANKQNVTKDYNSLLHKDKDKKNKFKSNKINNYIHNVPTNKNISNHNNKLINKSMELRNKIKSKLAQNIKSKIFKNKMHKKESMKTENILNKEFINNNNELNYTQRNKPPTKIEICQTFSKEENAKDTTNNTNESNKNIINNNNNINNDKSLIINTNYQYLKFDNLKPKTSTSKENQKLLLFNKEREIRTPVSSKSMEKSHKLQYLIGEYCINNNDKKNNKKKYTSISIRPKTKNYSSKVTSINKNNNFTTGNLIQKELKGIKHYINNYNMKKHINLYNLNYLDNNKKNKSDKLKKEQKIKNNDIFEVISDIKVKSLNEYQEEKKVDKNTKYNSSPSDNKIKHNININININYNNININNQINNDSNNNQYNSDINNISTENTNLNVNNGVFIEDRDEYNILKETFSKDRFSFRPINGDNNEIKTNYQQYNNIINNNINKDNNDESEQNSLSLKDFAKKDDIKNSNIINTIDKNNLNNKNNTNNTNTNIKNIDNKKIMKKEISKIQKLKKIIKNKQMKLSKMGTLNKSVELRSKKFK